MEGESGAQAPDSTARGHRWSTSGTERRERGETVVVIISATTAGP